MRTLDLILGSLGIIALGLMFTNAPSVHARSTELDQTDSTSPETEVAGFGEGQAEALIGGTVGKSAEAVKVAPEGVQCCINSPLTPGERAARARVLEQVLAPRASSMDRIRLGLLLLNELQLTEDEEREIS